MKISEFYLEKITPIGEKIIGVFDNRDYIYDFNLPDNIPDKFFNALNIQPPLNQGQTDQCTAFATFSLYATMLYGSGLKGNNFAEYYSDATAHYIGEKQFGYAQEVWFKKMFRSDFWRGRGRTLGAAMWSFNHGVKLQDGALLKIDEYYKFRHNRAIDFCKAIYKEGGMVVGLMLHGKPYGWYLPDGTYVGREKNDKGEMVDGNFSGSGHALHICGYNIKEGYLTYKGSYGAACFENGFGKIPFDKITHIGDARIIRGCKFQLPE